MVEVDPDDDVAVIAVDGVPGDVVEGATSAGRVHP